MGLRRQGRTSDTGYSHKAVASQVTPRARQWCLARRGWVIAKVYEAIGLALRYVCQAQGTRSVNAPRA